MGTNFYLMSKSKKLIRENFAVEKNYGVTDVEYELVDEPYLGYQIHLNKLSCGWRPLFQRHKNIKSFKQLEDFCMKNMAKSIHGNSIMTRYIITVNVNQNHLNGYMK